MKLKHGNQWITKIKNVIKNPKYILKKTRDRFFPLLTTDFSTWEYFFENKKDKF